MRWILLAWVVSSAPAVVARAQPDCERILARAEALGQRGEHRQAGDAYVTYAREHRSCGGLDAALYNAAVHYDAAGLRGRGVRVRQVLAMNFPDSPLLVRTLYQLAGGYHAMAMYSEAAEHYARFAHAYPDADGADCTANQRATGGCPSAADAIQNAIFFWLGLGDLDAVLEQAAFVQDRLASRHPRLAARVAASLGEVLERRERFEEQVAQDERTLRDHAEHLTRSEELGVLLRLGRARLRAEQPTEARALFARMEERYRAEPAVTPDDAGDQALDRVRAKDAIAEARVLSLEDEHARLLASLDPPRPPARLTERALRRFTEGPFAAWIAAREAELEQLEGRYERVAELEIPQWTIVSAERIARLSARLAATLDELTEAPVAGVEGPALASLRAPITTRRAAHRRHAEDRYAFCAFTAERVRWLDETSERCFAALDALRDRPAPAELAGEPRYADARPARPPPASRDDGISGTRRRARTTHRR